MKTFSQWLESAVTPGGGVDTGPLRHNPNAVDGGDEEDIFWMGIDPRVEPPRPGERWYRGHSHPYSRLHGPIWLTRDPKDAEFYAQGTDGLFAYEVSPDIRTGTYKDLVAAVRNSGARRSDIRPNSGYDGTNDHDFVYVPAVQRELGRTGIEALLLSDPLGNHEIDALVVLDKSKVRVSQN